VLLNRIRSRADRVAALRGADVFFFVLLNLSHIVVAIVFIAQAATGEPHSTDAGAITISAVTRSASAILVIGATIVRIRGRQLTSYRLAKAAILTDLLITEAFNFHDSQFSAVTELPHLLLAFAFFTIRQRQVNPA
jgi:hypothetical protein